MKLAFTNLFAFVSVSMALVAIETSQASALEDGELFLKRAPVGGGAVGGHRPAAGNHKPRGTATGANTGTPKPKTGGTITRNGGTGGAKGTPKPKGAQGGTGGAVGAGTGGGKGTPKPKGHQGGAAGGGKRAGGGGGGAAVGGGMAKRQVRRDYGLEKRESTADVIVEKRAPAYKPFSPSLDQFIKRSDDLQPPKMQKRNHPGMPMGMPPMGMHGPNKRSIDEDRAELEKRNHDPHGMHPVKRDNDLNLVKRNKRGRPRNRRPNRFMKRDIGLESKSFLVKRSHPNYDLNGSSSMKKRETDVQINQSNLSKRSRNKYGDKSHVPPKGISNGTPVY